MQLQPYFDALLERAGMPAGATRMWLAGLIAALVVMAITFAVTWFLVHVASRALRRLAARTATDVDDRILDIAERPVRRLIVTIGVYVAVSELPLPERAAIIVGGLLIVYMAFVAVRVATRVSVLALSEYGRRVEDEVGKERFEKDYVPLLTKLLGVVFFLVALIYVLNHFGQNVTSLIAALGIGGAAVGLAAKDTLGHMFAGFVILVDRPFRPGDRIKLVSGEIGDVVEVGTRSTRIRMLDRNMLIVPNSDLMNSRVVNLNYPAHPTQATLELKVAYGTDVDAVKQLVVDLVSGMPEVVSDPAPSVMLTGFGDHALILALSYVVSQFADGLKVQDRVRVAIYRKFAESGVKIPYPTTEVISAPPPTPAGS